MTRTITVCKANPRYGKDGDYSTVVSITEEVPDFKYESLAEWEEFADAQAQQICQALRASLPGGVLDRLLAHMMMAQASSLCVAVQGTLLQEETK